MITKQEILEKQFSKKFNGYDPVEVDEFLDEILKAFEALEQNGGYAVPQGQKATPRPQLGYAMDGKATELIEQAEKRAQEIMSATNENASMIIASAQERAQALRDEAKNYEYRIGELKNALRDVYKRQEDNGETVYKSGLISPGYFVENAKLDTPLAKGIYPAVAVFTAYDTETKQEMGTAGANVNLMIKN